ncbi:Fic family protein [Gordonia sp. X0973]|uniref:Fic family protein n=1 Tax=Gordonia sp. X0973 TaxID=2742602 RepID=UPI000F539EEF|nr:Fic family protein [Gordonia sp. X0973]QKT07133.1 Fic family protein [Gordonia sp. X0973]
MDDDEPSGAVSWPAHASRVVPWRQQFRAGVRADRVLTEVEVSLPPMIATLDVQVPSDLAADMEEALREITALDAGYADDLGALGTMLLRTECVASSRIEEIDARVDDYARALHGVRANSSATSMVSATAATDVLLTTVSQTRAITLDDLLAAHRELMRDEVLERDYAGRLRDMHNWIGGSDHSPRDALYVPPPPDTVADYMRDLIRYVNRDDLPVLAQVAIAHAQFESVHPFTDGNGRIGRALINSILRRRGVTSTVVVPLASALVAHRDRYFDDLESYREGNPAPLMRSFAAGSRIAAVESRRTAALLSAIPDHWHHLLGPMRSHSAAAKITASLIAAPIFTAEEVAQRLGLKPTSTYAAIERLHDADVIRPLTSRKRDQVWGAGLVLDELEALGARIKKAAT